MLQDEPTTPHADAPDPSAALIEHHLFDRPFIASQLSPQEAILFQRDPVAFYLAQDPFRLRPHALFDPQWYVGQHPEVIQRQPHPLLDYIAQGAASRLSPNPAFLPDWYVRHLSDGERAEFPDLLLHYATEGRNRNLSPHPLFDPAWYLERNADVRQSEADPLAHYLLFGAGEFRDPHPLINAAEYAKRAKLSNPADVVPHLWRSGMRSGLEAHPILDAPVLASGRKSPFEPPEQRIPALAWRQYNRQTPARTLAFRQTAAPVENQLKLKFSIIVPVHDPTIEILRDAVASVLGQSYRSLHLLR